MESLSVENYKFIAERLSFEFYNSGEEVMKYGESGNTFYIIIKGLVSVLVPNKE